MEEEIKRAAKDKQRAVSLMWLSGAFVIALYALSRPVKSVETEHNQDALIIEIVSVLIWFPF